MKKIISIILAVWVLLALCACGGKAGDKTESPADYDGKSGYGARESTEAYIQSEHEALLDYAERLEEAGNEEAAAAVYALLPQGGGAELIETMHDELPVLNAADELGQLDVIFDHLKGGDGA